MVELNPYQAPTTMVRHERPLASRTATDARPLVVVGTILRSYGWFFLLIGGFGLLAAPFGGGNLLESLGFGVIFIAAFGGIGGGLLWVGAGVKNLRRHARWSAPALLLLMMATGSSIGINMDGPIGSAVAIVVNAILLLVVLYHHGYLSGEWKAPAVASRRWKAIGWAWILPAIVTWGVTQLLRW